MISIHEIIQRRAQVLNATAVEFPRQRKIVVTVKLGVWLPRISYSWSHKWRRGVLSLYYTCGKKIPERVFTVRL